MTSKEADINSDIEAVVDRKESIGLMEPMRVSEDNSQFSTLTDLAVDLAAASAGLRRSLPPEISTALADLSTVNELLLQQLDRRARYASGRYRARPQRRL